MNRGSIAQMYWYDTARLGFNEAPIHESGKYRTEPNRATTESYRFNEAPIHESGKYPRHLSAAHGRAASMRPRFMNRGSDLRPFEEPPSGAASMRPRFMNRGSLGS